MNRRQERAAAAAARAAAPPPEASRLVRAPVFVISSVRSGSTLLRVILDSHSAICAPHEMHLRTLRLRMDKKYTQKSMDALGLDVEELEHLLWDRVLHRELVRSGKSVVVDKTPGNAFIWKRLARCWPDARYIFLLRHPASMVDSLMRGRKGRDPDETVQEVLKYVEGVESARNGLPGITVRYEDLTADPEAVTKEICRFLRIRWEPGMLDYGQADHGPYVPFIGDWSKKIKSGSVQPARPLPDPADVPEELREYVGLWGYPNS